MQSTHASRYLLDAAVVDASLGEALKKMVGFRTIAAHNYQELDVNVVRHILAHRLGDLRAFARILVGRGLEGDA